MVLLVNPIGNVIYEKLKVQKNITDVELMNEFNRNGMNISWSELNKSLMRLEILGFISVRWSGKDKRRIELLEKAEEADQSKPAEGFNP